MIKGVHTMFYSSKPEELRAFFRDKFGFTYTDVGEGWLIFDLPEADLGCHPAEGEDAHHPEGEIVSQNTAKTTKAQVIVSTMAASVRREAPGALPSVLSLWSRALSGSEKVCRRCRTALTVPILDR